MVLKTNPIKLLRNDENFEWVYAMDYHTLSSEYIGDDEQGRPRFDTDYSDMGNAIKSLKYKSRLTAVRDISDTMVDFLESMDMDKFYILPVPPSNRNRSFQPVFKIAERVAKKMGTKSFDSVLKKNNNTQIKNMSRIEIRQMHDMISMVRETRYPANVLLIDDIFSTGTTLKECAKALRKDANIEKIYAITATKTRKEKW